MPQTQNQASKDFVISRVFDAPRDFLWKCFTEPKHMQQWWGPKGVKIIRAEIDLRVGGTCLYGMQNQAGDVMWGKFVYREITPPERMIFINSFSDEAAGLTRHPLAPQWPLQLLSTFTVRWSPYEPTAEEQAAFDAGHDSMTMGWSGTMENLETYIARTQQQQQQ